MNSTPVSPEQIESFWRATLDRSKWPALDAEWTPVRDPVPYMHEKLTYTGLGGTKIVAHLGRPIVNKSEAPRRLPAIVTAPGAGGKEFGQTLSECQRGYHMLQIYPRHQGESGHPPIDDGLYVMGGESPQTHAFREVYVDMMRGIDALCARPDVDPDRIGFVSTSQGGCIALAVAALDPRVKAVVAHVPFLCDVKNHSYLVDSPLRKDPKFAAAIEYFDPINLAPRIKAPALVSTGGLDKVCPPEGIRAVFDRIFGIKCLFHDPNLIHTSSILFYELGWEWMKQHL